MRWEQLRMVGCDMHDSSSSTIPLAAGSRDQEFVAGTWTLPVCMTTWPVFGGRSADSGCIYIGRYAEVYWGVGSEVKLSCPFLSPNSKLMSSGPKFTRPASEQLDISRLKTNDSIVGARDQPLFSTVAGAIHTNRRSYWSLVPRSPRPPLFNQQRWSLHWPRSSRKPTSKTMTRS